MIGLLTLPARLALGLVLDVVLGPAEPYDYTSTTSPLDGPPECLACPYRPVGRFREPCQ